MSGDREVAEEKGKNFAEAHNLFFMETSAKMSINVEEAFNTMLKKIVQTMNEKEKKSDEDIQRRAN